MLPRLQIKNKYFLETIKKPELFLCSPPRNHTQISPSICIYLVDSAQWVIGPDYTSRSIQSAITGLQSPMDVGEGWQYYTHATGWTGDTMLTVTGISIIM